MYWAVEICANLLSIGLAIYYMSRMLEQKEKASKWNTIIIVFFCFAGMSYIGYSKGYTGLAGCLVFGGILFFYGVKCLCGGLGKKLLYTMLWNIIMLISTRIVFGGLDEWIHRHEYMGAGKGTIAEAAVRIVGWLTVLLLEFAMVRILIFINEKKKRKESGNIAYLLFLIFLCIVTIGNMYGLLQAEWDAGHDSKYIWILLTFAELFFCLVFMFYLCERWGLFEQERREYHHVKKINFEMSRFISNMLIIFKEKQIIKHDMKKYLYVVYTYVCNGQIEEAKKSLKKLQGNGGELPEKGSSVQIILSNRKEECEKEGIKFTYQVLGDWKKIDEMDLCSLMWNLLDNAVEASRKEEEKEILFEMCNYKGYLKIECKNKISRSVLTGNPFLKTSKENKNIHGIGLFSIRKVVKKYQGIQKTKEEEGFFVAHVYLQNT